MIIHLKFTVILRLKPEISPINITSKEISENILPLLKSKVVLVSMCAGILSEKDYIHYNKNKTNVTYVCLIAAKNVLRRGLAYEERRELST